jgi:hypothetical protein
MSTKQCLSIKSRKHPDLRCEAKATKGDFCVRHAKSKVIWTTKAPIIKPFTKKQKAAAEIIKQFWLNHGRLYHMRTQGPALFVVSESHNDKDIYTYDSIHTVPFTYHFSYADPQKRLWSFDLRFLLQLLQYGNDLKNPFTQESIPKEAVERLQIRAETLRKQKTPIIYAEPEGLTSEQIWNQKVLDVFLKLTTLGFGVNVIWFETLGIRAHEYFYRVLYESWTYTQISHEERERIVPGYNAGRTPLFRWTPDVLDGKVYELKWWRKQNLGLMNAFLSRGQDRATQGCGAIYILTALAKCHPRAREAFPYLVDGDTN